MAYASQTQLRYWWAPACTGPFTTVALYGSGRVMVRSSIVPAVQALNKIFTAYRYQTRYADTGGYNCRKVTGGSTYSLHAYGIAVDINWQSNPYSSTLHTDMFRYGDGRMPYRIEAIRTNDGHQVWRWGGWFSGNRDAMHYEITCAPSNIRSGINWSTVYGGTPVPAPAPTPAPQPTPQEDEDVRLIVKGKDKPEWWITDGLLKDHIETVDRAKEMVYVGLAKWDPKGTAYVVPQAFIDSIPRVEDHVRKCLNEGTGTGQSTWAGTEKKILSTVQAVWNKVNT